MRNSPGTHKLIQFRALIGIGMRTAKTHYSSHLVVERFLLLWPFFVSVCSFLRPLLISTCFMYLLRPLAVVVTVDILPSLQNTKKRDSRAGEV